MGRSRKDMVGSQREGGDVTRGTPGEFWGRRMSVCVKRENRVGNRDVGDMIAHFAASDLVWP